MSPNIEEDRTFVSSFVKCGASKSTSRMKDFFTYFDKNRNGFLEKDEFDNIIKALFTSDVQNCFGKKSTEAFEMLDKNQDGVIDLNEFSEAWTTTWFPDILDPVFALIVVDVQNDFISGSLALKHCPACQDGEEVVPIINKMIATELVDLVVFTLDWHPADHISFVENVKLRPFSSASKISDPSKANVLDIVTFQTSFGDIDQILWPTHCVQNSDGAKLHPDLLVPKGSLTVRKGTNCLLDSYSAFFDNKKLEKTNLDNLLRQHHVTHLVITGLATDVCVGFTAMDALSLGYRICVVEEACKGVNLPDINTFYSDLIDKGGVKITSDEFANIVSGKVRHMSWVMRPGSSS